MASDVNQSAPTIEIEVALLRQSLESNTETLKELRTDMKQSYALFATKAELAETKAYLEKEITEVRATIATAVRWLLGVIAAVVVALILAFLKLIAPHL